LEANFGGSTTCIRGATSFARLAGCVAVLTSAAGSIRGTAIFAGSSVAVLASATGSIRGTSSAFADEVFAHLVGTAIIVASAASFTSTRFTDFTSATVTITSTLACGTLAIGAALTTGAVIHALATFNTLRGLADLAKFALFVACTGGEALLAATRDTSFSIFAICIAAATFLAGFSNGGANRANLAICIGAANITATSATDTKLTRGAIIIHITTLAALSAAADFTTGALCIFAATCFTTTAQTNGSCFTIGVDLTLRRRIGVGIRIGTAILGITNAFFTITGTTEIAIFGDITGRTTGVLYAHFKGRTMRVATTLGGGCPLIAHTAAANTDRTKCAMCIAEAFIIHLGGTRIRSTEGIPRVHITIICLAKATKTARDKGGRYEKNGHHPKFKCNAVHGFSSFIGKAMLQGISRSEPHNPLLMFHFLFLS
jgi:hypothetical protein